MLTPLALSLSKGLPASGGSHVLSLSKGLPAVGRGERLPPRYRDAYTQGTDASHAPPAHVMA